MATAARRPVGAGIGHRQQGLGVGAGPAGARHHNRVAAVLPLAAHPARDDPHRRVEEQRRLDQSLEQVDQVVPSAHVYQLVDQDHLELIGAPATQGRRGQQDQWPDDAHQHRRRDPLADRNGHVAGDAQLSGQPPAEPGQVAVGDGGAVSTQPLGAGQSQRQPGEGDRRSDQPDPRQPRRQRIEAGFRSRRPRCGGMRAAPRDPDAASAGPARAGRSIGAGASSTRRARGGGTPGTAWTRGSGSVRSTPRAATPSRQPMTAGARASSARLASATP